MLATASASPCRADAAERAYYFERASTDDVLAQNTVNALLQDRAGFVWIATQGGLHRHDGYGFVLLQRDPERSAQPAGQLRHRAGAGCAGYPVGRHRRRRRGALRHGANRFIAIGRSPPARGRGKQAPVTALHFQAGRGLWIAMATASLLDQDEARSHAGGAGRRAR